MPRITASPALSRLRILDLTRVRAGPFASRGDAEKARDKLKGMGLAGNVIPK